MKKWFSRGAILLTVINLAALGTIGYHRWQHRHDDRDRSARGREMNFEKTLNLSDKQVVLMLALRDTLEQNIQPFREALRTRRDRFYELIAAPEADRPEIDRIQAEMDSLQAGIKRQVIAHMLAQKSILTPEQQQRYFSTLKKRYGDGFRREGRTDRYRREKPDG